jgi:hypothetical protein
MSLEPLSLHNLYLWISRAISCMNSRLQFYEPCSALGEFPLIMRQGVHMHHVGPAYHISPHIIVLFTYVPGTLKSTWMGQSGMKGWPVQLKFYQPLCPIHVDLRVPGTYVNKTMI